MQVLIVCLAFDLNLVYNNSYKHISMNDWFQKTIQLKSRKRGCYLITDQILNQIGGELKGFKVGLCNIFLLHTSAGISINENCDPTVRKDMETILNKLVPQGHGIYQHDDQGLDDMPAHAKTLLTGVSLNIPITNGTLGLGTWQGIWLTEFRNSSHSREITITLQGLRDKK